MAQSMVKVLTLEANQNNETTLFIFEKNWSVKFVPGPSLFAYDGIKLCTNYQVPFKRHEYHELSTKKDNSVSQSMNWSASIQFGLPGTYHYYFTANGSQERLGSGYFQVRPTMPLPLDCIQCQTVLSKNLGTLDLWLDRLAVSHQCGYNIIHFTPIQELGGSNSAYSIANQLKLNPSFCPSLGTDSFKDVAKIVDRMSKEWKVLSISDIVLNHTANESIWLTEHPDAAYSCYNSPHLRPAFLLDRAIFALTIDLANERWIKTHMIGNKITSEADLKVVSILLNTFYLPTVKLHELFMLDIDKTVKKFEEYIAKRADKKQQQQQAQQVVAGINVIQDKFYRRFHSTIDFEAAAQLTTNSDELRHRLQQENNRLRSEIDGHLSEAIKNVLSAIRYERLQEDGPKFSFVCEETPLVAPYFKSLEYPGCHEKINLRKEEAFTYDERQSQFLMAHNGWVMNYDPLKNFAEEGSLIYFRRELVAWGDSVKLRYGDRPEDSPYLWAHMKAYVEKQAEIFHGLRLDNCHSTPVHVAEYMLDAARLVRPDIYIIAELFTSSEAVDNIFINRLGVTSLVRESMSAPSGHELGRLVYRFGGQALGAFHFAPGSQPLKPSMAHAIFYDQTHDNPSPINKRSAYDCAATSSIVSMACCASGTTRGYDELVPHHINVVHERRLYQSWADDEPERNNNRKSKEPVAWQQGFVGPQTGLVPLRRLINDLHSRLFLDNFCELFVDQVDPNVLAITRHNPDDCRSIVLVARTAFNKVIDPDDVGPAIRPIFVPGTVDKILFQAKMVGDPNEYTPSATYINGLYSFRSTLLTDSSLVSIDSDTYPDQAKVQFDHLVPSAVLAIETHPSQSQAEALIKVRLWLKQEPELNKLTLADINYILYRCQEEDSQDPVYELPNLGRLPYAGWHGFMFLLERVRTNQDQAHPLCCNLRDGNWLIDHTLARLRRRPSLAPLVRFLGEALDAVARLPRSIVPKYFDMVMANVYTPLVQQRLPKSLGSFVRTGPKLAQTLALSSLAVVGECNDARLAPWNDSKQEHCSIAAGLPHFASGYMRNWGRDTFISMRGLLLLTERFEEARAIILSFGATLRHGLIPNLLDGGAKARYNCRDAVWWWLYSIKEYTELFPGNKGYDLLEEQVHRLYPYDHSEPHMTPSPGGRQQPLCALMQEALECHFDGIDFVERNAGSAIDEHMTEPGFHVQVNVDRDTGFVVGGNQWNCGTWMDKMGSSVKAKNKGEPASSRDGAAVEIVGLSYAIVKWLSKISTGKQVKYRYRGVESKRTGHKWSWADWAEKIEANFERHYWIGGVDDHKYHQRDLINRRHIYMDLWRCEKAWQAYQFRPNFLVAMVVAPELFTPSRARQCIDTTRQVLVGPLGMKTLDPTDWNYHGDYDNSDDSENKATAHGFNYHQGPEWLWPTGFYLRASMRFSAREDPSQLKHIKQLLAHHYQHLEGDKWYGLPELTNSNGQFCKDSCPIQAWSLATIMEALWDFYKMKAA